MAMCRYLAFWCLAVASVLFVCASFVFYAVAQVPMASVVSSNQENEQHKHQVVSLRESGSGLSRLHEHWIDWERSMLHLSVIQGPSAGSASSSYEELVKEAWREGIQEYRDLAKRLYIKYYKNVSLRKKMDVFGVAGIERQAQYASLRASRYVFSTLSEYYSHGKVRVRLSSRLAAVFAKPEVEHLAQRLGAAPVELPVKRVIVRFLCDVSPHPYLVVHSKGEKIYAPHLIAREAYEEKLMGIWLAKEQLELRKRNGLWPKGSSVYWDLKCTHEAGEYDLDSPETWDAMDVSLQTWLVRSASVAFVY